MTAATVPHAHHRPLVTPPRIWAALALLLIAAIAVFITLFQWNWLRGPLARYLSARLDRPVTISGNLVVHPWSWNPSASVSGVTIGNPKWAGAGPMARLPSFSAQIELKPLILHGKVILPLVEADRPAVALYRDAAGRENWRNTQNGKPRPLKLPAIEHLVMRDGVVSYVDVHRQVRFRGVASSSEDIAGSGRGVFRLDGAGTLKGARFTLAARGGPLIHIDPNKPYRFVARIDSGATRIAAEGAFARPFDFGHISGRVHASGQDFGQLYSLTGVALPDTPPYDLTAGFARAGEYFAFRRLSGRVGDSDLAGAISVNDTTRRPFVTADLVSNRLHLTDLEAVIGGGPRHTAGHVVSRNEKIMAAKLTAEHRLLPDARLDVRRIRATDARLTYSARRVIAGKLPTKNLYMKLALDHGLLTIDPFAVRLPEGDLAGRVRLNARGATPFTAIDFSLANARLENLIERGGTTPPVTGGLYARAALAGAGDSVRAAAAHANGQFTVVIPGGQMRQAFAELMGIDVARGLILILTKNHGATPIRCAVADFRARDGVLQAQSIVLDTGVVIATGSGDVNLRDETMNLAFAGKPKKFRLLRIGAPITLKGPLEKPKLGVDVAKAAPQAALSVALGALAWPLAAIVPFIAPGAKGADCATLTAQAEARGAPVGRR
ncbi:MAG: AsmA family protein [Caulobacteraceae bacterium]